MKKYKMKKYNKREREQREHIVLSMYEDYKSIEQKIKQGFTKWRFFVFAVTYFIGVYATLFFVAPVAVQQSSVFSKTEQVEKLNILSEQQRREIQRLELEIERIKKCRKLIHIH